ncbi:glycine betaine ABC transporter substrate-binding protein OsmF [Devosia rhizoryzae]|uniref:ABC transporter substrate-binding protein n=1 Tax=Devosia rhizoryzae TaxID=2774137 RepID=A0ABX7CAI9_9HYPH|nr:ABC transporter substrate-binding protein [Devosia rhizoryzae]QQR40798.1 ABC transporter substrate-binding protein [Devosia rhizoryzae]
MSIMKLLAGVVAGAALLTSAASAQVVVSSKIDTEGALLGNIILQVLDAKGIEVTDRTSLGATPIVRAAIEAGEIDIYPEYTSNVGFAYNVSDDPAWKDAKAAYAFAKVLDYDNANLVWLQPAPANNTWAVAITQKVADENGISTFSDFGKFVAEGGNVKLAASAEFVNSASALPAFQQAYGFSMKPNQMVVLSGGDTAATIAAAGQGTAGVNAAMVYGTDGAIAAAGLVVLQDDKGVQPVYEPAPLVREEVLLAHPEIKTALEPVFEKLDLVTLQTLNGRIQVDGEAAADVARDWLTDNGFLS